MRLFPAFFAVYAAMLLTHCVSQGSCGLVMLKGYDVDFTLKLAREVGETPLDSATREYLVDQTILRDAIRACRRVP